MDHFELTQINWCVKRVYCGLCWLTRLWHVSYFVAFGLTRLWPNPKPQKPHVEFVSCSWVGSNIDTPIDSAGWLKQYWAVAQTYKPIKEIIFIFWVKYKGKNTILVPKFWSHNQFRLYYCKFTINLVPVINSLIWNAYVVNGLYIWHI